MTFNPSKKLPQALWYSLHIEQLFIGQLSLTAGEQQKEFLPLTAIPEKKENYIELKRWLWNSFTLNFSIVLDAWSINGCLFVFIFFLQSSLAPTKRSFDIEEPEEGGEDRHRFKE